MQMDDSPITLLAPDEPHPVTVSNEGAASPFVIVVDHAGNHLPRSLQMLGLAPEQCEGHIAWDIGAGGVALLLGEALGAIVIRQHYSRLAIDCNRTPGSETSIVELSEHTVIPGNIGLGKAQAQARVREIFKPYHERIARELDRRRQAGMATVLIAMHSFTPVFKSVARRWQVGMLYNRDPRLARILMELLRRDHGLEVGDNEPYRLSDESDYTIPVHGERRNMPHVEIEVRQDLIGDAAGQRRWASLLTEVLLHAYERLRAAAS